MGEPGPPSGPFFPFCSPRFHIKLPNTTKGALFIPRLLGILGTELIDIEEAHFRFHRESSAQKLLGSC